jgi:hypothetical protein
MSGMTVLASNSSSTVPISEHPHQIDSPYHQEDSVAGTGLIAPDEQSPVYTPLPGAEDASHDPASVQRKKSFSCRRLPKHRNPFGFRFWAL